MTKDAVYEKSAAAIPGFAMVTGTQSALSSGIILSAEVFESKRPDRRHLSNIFTRFRPVEVGCTAWKDNHTAGRIRLELIGIKSIAQSNIETV
jgi:hypothetical protein